MTKKSLFPTLLAFGTLGAIAMCVCNTSDSPASASSPDPHMDSLVSTTVGKRQKQYRVVTYPSTNYEQKKRNSVEGVVLHHTAVATVEETIDVLNNSPRGVGAHVVIDYDGTRYIMCAADIITYHAGPSALHGRESCNQFCVGVEFVGNTLSKPLTDDQILSGIEYLKPIIAKYHIPMENIVTHEMVRKAYQRLHPEKSTPSKVDITQKEYHRFMKALRTALSEKEGNTITTQGPF